MRKLVLIKHAMPILQSEVASSEWQLSDEGRQKATELASYLKEYKTNTIYSSTEPKAIETATIASNELGSEVVIKEDLHEHLRRTKRKIYPVEEFHNLIRNFFHYKDMLIFGEETANMAKKRFTTAITNLLKEVPEQEDVIVVTHGTVMTLFVSEYNEIDEFDLWSSFGLPSIVELSLEDFSILNVKTKI